MISDLNPAANNALTRQLPPDDAPQMQTAMKVWENLTVKEQANVFRGLYARVVAYRQTGDGAHLENIEDSLFTMVLMESRPGFTEARRRPSCRCSMKETDMAALIASLRTGGGSDA